MQAWSPQFRPIADLGFIQKAALSGDAHAQWRHAGLLFQKGQWDEGLNWMYSACLLGYVPARIDLAAYMDLHGLKVYRELERGALIEVLPQPERDTLEGLRAGRLGEHATPAIIEALRIQYHHGRRGAGHELASIYLNFRPYAEPLDCTAVFNRLLGLSWLETALRDGDPLAYCDLGELALHGLHMPKDHALAALSFESAVALGAFAYTVSLGLLYLNPELASNLIPNARHAAAIFEYGTQKGVPKAARNLAIMYDQGIGVPVDPDKSSFFRQQAESLKNQAEHLGRTAQILPFKAKNPA